MLEEYIENKVRQDIIKEINNLELPHEWKPKEVINFIIRKIDKGNVK
jgi:hypothetical protein